MWTRRRWCDGIASSPTCCQATTRCSSKPGTRRSKTIMTMNRILLVCIGNICRSPLAEALLKQHFPDKTVHSAGLAALVGHPADSTAQDIAHQHGLDLSAHRAQQITQAMCRSADLILVMESEQQRERSEERRVGTECVSKWKS